MQSQWEASPDVVHGVCHGVAGEAAEQGRRERSSPGETREEGAACVTEGPCSRSTEINKSDSHRPWLHSLSHPVSQMDADLASLSVSPRRDPKAPASRSLRTVAAGHLTV